MEPGARQERDGAEVTEPRAVVAAVWAGLPLLGAGAGWLVKWVAGWVTGLRWAPLRGPATLITSIPDPQLTIGALAIGAAAGLALAYLAAKERLAVAVSRDRVVLRRGGTDRTVERAAIAGVFLDGKHLVLLGPAATELAREKSDLEGDALRAAFTAYGYRWLPDGDPHRDEYRTWVPDLPDLPPAVNVLLKARAEALKKGSGRDAADLRADLAKLGIVVRDEGKRQYWRRIASDADAM